MGKKHNEVNIGPIVPLGESISDNRGIIKGLVSFLSYEFLYHL